MRRKTLRILRLQKNMWKITIFNTTAGKQKCRRLCYIIVFFIVIDLTAVSACESRYPNGQKRLLGLKTTSLPLAWFYYSIQQQPALYTPYSRI